MGTSEAWFCTNFGFRGVCSKLVQGAGAGFLPLTQVCLVCEQRCDGKLPVDAEKPAPTIGLECTRFRVGVWDIEDVTAGRSVVLYLYLGKERVSK